MDDTVYPEIRPRAASTPCLYGLPKLHKDNCPLRPILSATGSFTYQTASWLSNILKPFREHSTVLQDSFQFMNQISKIPNLQNKFLVSFDVESLFTNIPLDFTLNLILDMLFIDQSTKIFGMNRKHFKKLLDWTCKNGTLQFNGKFYKQVDGVAMGSPLAPAIADICMNWLLEEVFKKITASFKIFWYVDDLFFAFDHSEDIEDTFNAFNSIHNKIQFTREPEVENQLAFLDVHITKTREGVETKIFRKPTFTGLYINWQSYVPLKYTKNLLFTLLDRAYKICNSYAFIHQEFQKISTLLQKNGFPTHFIDHHIAKFFNQKYQKCQTINSTESPKPRLLFIRLPYVHLMSNQIRKEINSFFQKLNVNAKLILIDETFNIGRFFTHKDKQHTLCRSNVVHQINCSCGEFYIGQTQRNLITRLNDHNPAISTSNDTDVTKHLWQNPDHHIDFNNPIVLSHASNWRKLLIKETLLIQEKQPQLNIDKTSTPLYLFNT